MGTASVSVGLLWTQDKLTSVIEARRYPDGQVRWNAKAVNHRSQMGGVNKLNKTLQVTGLHTCWWMVWLGPHTHTHTQTHTHTHTHTLKIKNMNGECAHRNTNYTYNQASVLADTLIDTNTNTHTHTQSCIHFTVQSPLMSARCNTSVHIPIHASINYPKPWSTPP